MVGLRNYFITTVILLNYFYYFLSILFADFPSETFIHSINLSLISLMYTYLNTAQAWFLCKIRIYIWNNSNITCIFDSGLIFCLFSSEGISIISLCVATPRGHNCSLLYILKESDCPSSKNREVAWNFAHLSSLMFHKIYEFQVMLSKKHYTPGNLCCVSRVFIRNSEKTLKFIRRILSNMFKKAGFSYILKFC